MNARKTMDANEAVASVAYRLSETIAIYPITPASPMGEHADEWSAAGKHNLFGQTPQIVEMQSEAGAAGAVHGALQGGSLATTFTASQGLLLMLPNLYKITGELSPCVVHVAARSVATHALSIFGDHSDVMAVRPTGMAMLCASSPQEAQDLAAIAHAASLASRVPFLHFFDGFRTSHEIQNITVLHDEHLSALIDVADVEAHHARGLSPEHPVVRGTAQNPDAFFQGREAQNGFFTRCEEVVAERMERFAALTGRRYAPFEYFGHPQAERVVVLMGSGAECARETVEALVAKGEKVGGVQVRLYRPFGVDRLLGVLPNSVRGVAVLDRTKEPGSVSEPLLLDVTGALVDGLQRGALATLPRLIGGRYGLSSKEFTPRMLRAVFDELAAASPRARFTVGINDDVTRLSLPVDADFSVTDDETVGAVFYGLGSDGTVSSNKATIKIIGEKTGQHCQGHFVYDSKKSGSMTVSHLRFGNKPIRSTYLIEKARFVGVHDPGLFFRQDVLERAAPGAVVLIQSSAPREKVFADLPEEAQRTLIERGCHLYAIDAASIAEKHGLGRRINTIMQACFFALAKVMPVDDALAAIKQSVVDTWGKRGPEIVRRNFAAIDDALANLQEIARPAAVIPGKRMRATVRDDAPDFVKKVTALMLEGKGDLLPVSAFPVDGTWPTGTAKHEKRAIAPNIPIWEPDICIQCNRCSVICPHSAVRTKVFEPAAKEGAPPSFKAVPEHFHKELAGLDFIVQVAPEDCTGCGLCVEVCPAKDRTMPKRKAINMAPFADNVAREREAFDFFLRVPDVDKTRIPRDVRTLPLLQPLFEFSGACAGCGETPYIRLLTQLFGDRLIIANATGCSSIYGGNLPTTPYGTDAHGRGPAWANSLFEDNAEFGLGIRLGADAQAARARMLLGALASTLPPGLADALLSPCSSDDEAQIAARRGHVAALKEALRARAEANARELLDLADNLVPRCVWLVGGDGWAYDIGYGGLDHVLASRANVKVLVLDTEVYSNTGGQQSKATPLGAVAKFASAGKETRKKDLGLLAMSYGHIYVASVGLQAKNQQTIQAFLEAESFPGPALIVAHSPCIAHGYDLVDSPAHQKRAIESGAWPLYRFDPRRAAAGGAPLLLDADPGTLPIRKYMEEEARFRMVELKDPARYERLVAAAARAVKERHAVYAELAKIQVMGARHG